MNRALSTIESLSGKIMYFNEHGSMNLSIESYFDEHENVHQDVIDSICMCMALYDCDAQSDAIAMFYSDKLSTHMISSYATYLNYLESKCN